MCRRISNKPCDRDVKNVIYFKMLHLSNERSFLAKRNQITATEWCKIEMCSKEHSDWSFGGVLQCDCDHTWIWTLTKEPICMKGFSRIYNPFAWLHSWHLFYRSLCLEDHIQTARTHVRARESLRQCELESDQDSLQVTGRGYVFVAETSIQALWGGVQKVIVIVCIVSKAKCRENDFQSFCGEHILWMGHIGKKIRKILTYLLESSKISNPCEQNFSENNPPIWAARRVWLHNWVPPLPLPPEAYQDNWRGWLAFLKPSLVTQLFGWLRWMTKRHKFGIISNRLFNSLKNSHINYSEGSLVDPSGCIQSADLRPKKGTALCIMV